MRKRLVRLLVGVALLAALVVVAAWLALRGSLPQLDGEIAVAGIEAAATIARDADGIPVITAASRKDLAFATGFAHGQDRFFQMDLIRRQAAGELAALVGSAAIDVDKRYRLHRFRARAGAVWELATENDRMLMRAYAAGVNAGLGSLDARPFEYLILGSDPEPW